MAAHERGKQAVPGLAFGAASSSSYGAASARAPLAASRSLVKSGAQTARLPPTKATQQRQQQQSAASGSQTARSRPSPSEFITQSRHGFPGGASGALGASTPSAGTPGSGGVAPNGVPVHSIDGRDGPRIIAFQNLAHFSHNTDSVVSVDEPLFKPTPAAIDFRGFEGLQTYDATLSLRNQDNVARRVKILPPDSSFFEVMPGRGRKASSGSADKVAPGMEVSYIIRFKPDVIVENYSYDLVVVTERERFTVPLRAQGGSAVLDIPDAVAFGSVPVRYESSKTVLVRNVGEKATKFLLRTTPPFSTSLLDGYLEVGGFMQVDVLFRPERAETYDRELVVAYGDGIEVAVALSGVAENIDVEFSANKVGMSDTFIALSTQTSIVIHNRSDVPVDFSWRAFPTIEEEIGQKLKLQVQLKHEEGEEIASIRSMNLEEDFSDDDSDESLSETSQEEEEDEESVIRKAEEKALAPLSRRYRNIAKAIMEDPMFFYDEIFAIEPLAGRIWAKSKTSITVTFTPKAALNYQCLAFCSIVGRADRMPLMLRGQGIGPKAAFSYDELDVGDVFVESVHQYEVDLINQGDIAVNVQLVSNPSPFGSRFTFTPSQSRLEVGGQCTVTVEFCPDLLGEFCETFYWDLVGSTSSIPLTFKGHSVSPTFTFDVDRISFGVVSYGFLNSKTLTLTNTSEVMMRFALRIPGDGRFAQKEFDVIPPRGMLLPNCSQKVQIDFISVNVKTYDLCLVVDLDGVGQELASIPIQARCAVPVVSLEPAEVLEYGEIFVRFPAHQTLVLQNMSALPAKFQIAPQDEQSRSLAEFEPDQVQGSVPPASSHVLTLALTSFKLGPLQIPITIRILGHNVMQQIMLTANSIGPIVSVEPASVDWGNARCLEPVTRSVTITNNSVIDATVKAFMKTKHSLWSITPKSLSLRPYESAQMDMTLTIDEAVKMNDLMHLVVEEGKDSHVAVKGKGVGTPMTCKESLSVIDFGTQYTTQTITREYFIENRGRKPRKLVWLAESLADPKAAKSAKEQGETNPLAAPIFTVTPETLVLEAKCGYRYQFHALCTAPGQVSENFICQEFAGNERKGSTVFRTEFRGDFVAPLLKLSSETLTYRFFWEQGKPISPMAQTLEITNVSPLDVKFILKVQPPFHVSAESLALHPEESAEVRVEFDPGFKVDRICGVVKNKLTVHYHDHPQKDHVNLVGDVVFPNLSLSEDKLDFGSVLNETTKQMTIKLENPHPLPVNYQWVFVEECEATAFEDVVRTRTGDSFNDSRHLGDTNGSPGSLQGTHKLGPPQADDPPLNMTLEGSRQVSMALNSTQGGLQSTQGPMATTGTLKDVPPVDINQIFDILPIMGTIEPGASQEVTFTYFGLSSRKFETLAVCQTEGGPEYEISLKGQASKVEFKIDKTDLDFGQVLYNDVLERDIFITNTGKVAYYFSFNLSGVSRPFVLDASPMSGLINPEEKQRILIKFRAGIPDKVSEVALLEVAHFEPVKIVARGVGVFPGVLMGIPGPEGAPLRMLRMDEEDHSRRQEAAKVQVVERAKEQAAAAREAAAMASSRPRRTSYSDSAHLAAAATAAEAAVAGSDDGEIAANDIESEVDRAFLCEALLAQEKQLVLNRQGALSATAPGTKTMGTSSKGLGLARLIKDLPPITAAYYRCDFGNIVLGLSGKKIIHVTNCYSESISFNMNRKFLGAAGFVVTPDKVKNLPSGKSVRLEVTCFRAKDASEGTQELDWVIPLKGGPTFSVRLTANFVLPDLQLSSARVDFGRVLVGQVKRITIKLKNTKAVPVDWEYKAPRSKFGKPLAPWEMAYTLSPRSGKMQSGEIVMVTISFAPNAPKALHQKLALRIGDNPNKKILALHGVGDALRCEVRPSTMFKLGPVLPGSDNCVQEFFLHNPTDYPTTVYSVDFDKAYLEEEEMLRLYESYDAYNLAELPVRGPGSDTWADVAGNAAKKRREKQRREAAERKKKEREERVQEAIAKGEEPPPEDEEENDDEEPSEGEEAERSKTAAEEAEEEGPEMDLAAYPHRVADLDRLNVLIVGPPMCGKTSTAQALSARDGRRVLTLDDIVDWALAGPRSLQSAEDTELRMRLVEHKNQVEEQHEQRQAELAAKAKGIFIREPCPYAFAAEDIALLIKKRTGLPDCNCGVIFDGMSSKFVNTPEKAAEAIVAGLGERLAVLSLGVDGRFGLRSGEAVALSSAAAADGALPPELAAAAAAAASGPLSPAAPKATPKAAAAPAPALVALEGDEEEEEGRALTPEEAIAEYTAALHEHFAALQPALRASQMELQEALTKAEAEVAAIAEAAHGDEGQTEAAVVPHTPASRDSARSGKSEEPEALKEREAQAQRKEQLATEIEDLRLKLERCNAALAKLEASVLGKEEALAKESLAELVLLQTVSARVGPEYFERKAKHDEEQASSQRATGPAPSAVAADEAGAGSRFDPPDRQEPNSTLRPNDLAAIPESSSPLPPEDATALGDRLATAGSAAQRSEAPGAEADAKAAIEGAFAFLAPLPLGAVDPSGADLFAAARAVASRVVPMPLVPDEPPLPPPSFAQLVSRPPNRPAIVAPEHFTILTPAPRPSAAGGEGVEEAAAGGSSEEDSAAPSTQTRWLIQPGESQRVLLKFFSDSIGDFAGRLRFEVVGGINGNAPIALDAIGTTAFPAISSDPRNVFMRRVKMTPPNGYASKQYVASLDVYDFGPLLAGRDASSGDLPLAAEGQPAPVLDRNVLKHIEHLRITNSGPFEAKVSFCLQSDLDAESHAAADEKKRGGGPPKASFEEFPFIIEPRELTLDVDETKEVKVGCFPVKEGDCSDTLVAKVQDNPEPVKFNLCAIGATPKVVLESKEVNFDRQLLNQSSTLFVKLSNVCAVPVRWRLVPPATGGIPSDFAIDPPGLEGTMSPAEERNISVTFSSLQVATHKFIFKLQIGDTEGLKEMVDYEELSVSAEAFSVDVVPTFPNNGTGIDFGDIRVGLPVEQEFQVTNNGKYAVNFEVKIRRKAIVEILEIENGASSLDPGQKQTVKVRCAPQKEMQCPELGRRNARGDELELAVFEAKTGDLVQTNLPPITLSFRAMFNSFTVSPPRGLNFPPVRIGDSGSHEFELYNDGMFKFDWHLFDPMAFPKPGGDGKTPAAMGQDLVVGPFKISPATGALNPKESKKVVVTFVATEDKHYDSKIGIHVDGMPDAPSNGGRSGTAMRVEDHTAQNFFIMANGSGGREPGFREYLLTAESCTPGIDTETLQAIFEEQFVARSLEDAIATAGRTDIRAFCEDDKVFSFGPVIVSGPGAQDASGLDAAKFRITNPKAIPCDVKLDIKARPGGVAGKDPLPFELSTAELSIPPKEYRYVKVRFRPPSLQTYSAIFEASVPEGKDPKTNLLQFELRGDGTVPTVTLEGPPVFGDAGGEFNFGKLQVGKSHAVEFTLRNDGIIPATARYEVQEATSHFSVSCPKLIPLEPKAKQPFQIRFHPQEPGDFAMPIRITTTHNPFEDASIRLTGVGFKTEVGWDLKQAPKALNDEELSADGAAAPALFALPAPDELDLGSVAIGGEASATFHITNTSKDPIRFSFPETLPAPFASVVSVSPSVGHVKPGGRKAINLVFKPTEKLQEKAPLEVAIVSIAYQGEAEDWDDTMRTVAFSPRGAESRRASGAGGDAAAAALPSEAGKDKRAPMGGMRKSSVGGGVGGGDSQVQEEPAHRLLEGSERGLPLTLAAVADERTYECSTTSIAFGSTVLFQSRVHRFTVSNSSSLPLPYTWRFAPAAGGGRGGGQGTVLDAYKISPAKGRIPPGASQEFSVRFSPTEVEKFAVSLQAQIPDLPESRPPLTIAVDAAALRPWCHFELPASDYRSRRQAEGVLDPKYQVVEFESLGTRVKNTRRFYVLNPTAESYDFVWKPDGVEKNDDPFRCVTRRGSILSGKKYEMVFEYLPTAVGMHESFWNFHVVGKDATQSFLLVGEVKEPRIGTDKPGVNFGRLLLNVGARETVNIVNKEHLPFSFTISKASFELDGQVPVVSVSPLSGVVSPGASFPLEIAFQPTEEKSYNFNVVVSVKRREKPILLNVKGEGYKIHTKLVLEDPNREDRVLHPGVRELLDFGELQVQERRSFKLRLSSPSFKRSDQGKGEAKNDGQEEAPAQRFDFIWQLRTQSGGIVNPRVDAPPFIHISPMHGVATQEEETIVTVEYAAPEPHELEGATLRMLIPSGPGESSYTLRLAGRTRRPKVDFSTTNHDFGPCFVKRGGGLGAAGEPTSPTGSGTPFERLDLVITNRDSADCWLSTAFQRTSHLDVQLQPSMIESGKSLVVPIIFTPRDYQEYRERIEFVVNDCTRSYVVVRGRGCELQLELASVAMQNVNFGVTVGNQPVNRSVKVVNRSQRAVEFSLFDPEGKLGERCVSWTPPGPLTLRPKETTALDLRFNPSFQIAAFKLPLLASTGFSQDVHLLNVAGECHTAEVKLSEHSVLFGEVVFQSTGVRKIKLHNFGDLGVKFRFEVPARAAPLFSVEPSEGFAAPHDDVELLVKFHPIRSGGVGDQVTKEAEQGKPKRIRCHVEPSYQQEPVELIVQGRGIEQPAEAAQTLEFVGAVREKVVKEITVPSTVKNTSSEPWKLNPVLKTEVPGGVDYWFCPQEVTVPAGGHATFEIAYKPLTMTLSEEDKQAMAAETAAAVEAARGDDESGAVAPAASTTRRTAAQRKPRELRPQRHSGSVFIATPDGNAVVYNLIGTAKAPLGARKLSAEVQCKTPHVQAVEVSNWLQESQRFNVNLKLVEPADAGQEIKLRGVETFDLPPGLTREYKFNAYAYKEGRALARLVFTNPKTEEFLTVEVEFKFVAPEKVGQINLSTSCRQMATHPIAIFNPLPSPVRFACESSCGDIRFSPHDFAVPANSEATLDVIYQPILVGSGTATLRLKSAELGDYPYKVTFDAKPAGLEKAPVFKAPLGSDIVQSFKFQHIAKKPATYTARVEAAPGHKGPMGDFVVESKDIKAAAMADQPVQVSIDVRFSPSQLGESRTMLVLSSPDGGDYKALLMGYAQPPKPQGPVQLTGGKPGEVEFSNPFEEVVEFTIQVDNPSFIIGSRTVRVDGKKSTKISVQFKSDKKQKGSLIVTAPKVSTPWKYFLEGSP